MSGGRSPAPRGAILRPARRQEPEAEAFEAEIVEAGREPAPLARPGVWRATKEDLLQAFFRGRTKNTLDNYQRDLKALAEFFGVETTREAVGVVLGWEAAEANLVAYEWLGEMAAIGWAPSTRARRLSTLRSLTRMARRIGLIGWTVDVEQPKVHRTRAVRGPTKDDALRLLAVVEATEDERERLRNAAMFRLLLYCGLRRAEVAALQKQHYQDGSLSVKGKGGKTVKFRLPRSTATAIEAWIEREGIRVPEAPLFHAMKTPGRSLSLSGINKIVKAAGDKAGLRVWPHALRHSAVTVALDELDGNVRDASKFARHSSPTTTMLYDDDRKDVHGSTAQMIEDRFEAELKEKASEGSERG